MKEMWVLVKKLELNQLEDDQSGCSLGFTWPVKEVHPERIADIWWTCYHSLVSPKMTCHYPDLVELLIGWNLLHSIWSRSEWYHAISMEFLCYFLSCHFVVKPVACEDSHFSSLYAAGDVSRRGTSVSQQQKFYTDDVKSAQNPVRSADRKTV